MAVQVSYPGVYIDEFAPGAPIEGVGTGVAAFLGPAARGEIAARPAGAPAGPTLITSWDQFRAEFGDGPLPGFYLWYAVRGFFENGGQTCYVARVSNGDYQTIDLDDREGTPRPVVRARARQPGAPATPPTVAVALRHLLTTADTELYRPTGTLSAAPTGRNYPLGVGEGPRFRPGDALALGGAGALAVVAGVAGDTLRLDRDLPGPFAAGDAVRLADYAPGALTVRVQSTALGVAAALVPGAVLTFEVGTATAHSAVVDRVLPEFISPTLTTYRVTFRDGLRRAVALTAAAPLQSEEIDLTVAAGAPRPYQSLGLDPAHPRYYVAVVNDDADGPVRLDLVDPPPPVPMPLSLPAAQAAIALAGGADETLATLATSDYTDALDTLREVDAVNLVAAPDASVETPTVSVAAVQGAVLTHCELLGDRFAVLDAAARALPFAANGSVPSVETQRAGLTSGRGYAALYYPWLRVPPSGSGPLVLTPPSGHVCGIMARTDATRGVHKAPANEEVRGALGVERTMSDVDQGLLNLQGINVIRVFGTGGRPVLWGARTTAADTNWQYVSVRRLFLFLEESIEEGIRWAVFEPNNLSLWQKLRRTITDFLTRAWRDGALFGAKPEEAFYVRIDEALNPFSEQALGRLHIEIGVRPSYPAEFIIVRIGIWDGGQQVDEG
ncbi:hypothetical protein tb265_48940 [Gemmatimonadetes bacterium T265]|nr:hypothetical protein tb265_48940 [Gemmatimonadetes bacterium T265]